MANAIWQSGRRLFSSAGVLMLLTAVAHTAAHFLPSSGPAEDQLIKAMGDFHLPIGFGMYPSMLDFQNAMVFTMTITFLALGVINLLLAGSS